MNAEEFAEARGTYPRAVSQLRRTGHEPITTKKLLEERIKAFRGYYPDRNPENQDSFNYWWLKDSDTCDGFLLHRSGRFKIIPRAEFLLNMGSKPRLAKNKGEFSYGSFVLLDEDHYRKAVGEEFQQKDRMYFNTELSDKDIMRHPGWIALVGQQVLNDMVECARTQFRDITTRNRAYEGPIMQINLPHYHFGKEAVVGKFIWALDYSSFFNLSAMADFENTSDMLGIRKAEALARKA
jgi:hypothetical protein